MGNRHKSRDSEIARDVEHPEPASDSRELHLQVANIGILELAEIDGRNLEPIVPPDGIGIALDELEEALDDCFFPRIAGRATVGIGRKGAGPAMEKIEQARRQMFEASVAQ